MCIFFKDLSSGMLKITKRRACIGLQSGGVGNPNRNRFTDIAQLINTKQGLKFQCLIFLKHKLEQSILSEENLMT